MGIALIEDCCESLGAAHWENTLQDPLARKLGTIGLASNFSFYYAHHMSTIEGGMVCTDNDAFYDDVRMLRSHGLVRESPFLETKSEYRKTYPDLDPQFIFAYPAFNVRSTEINAVIGRSQLKRLDANNDKRSSNLACWIKELDESKFVVDYKLEGACNYALPLVLTEPNTDLMEKVIDLLIDEGVEYRRGTAGGGNQLRQPYLRRIFQKRYEQFAHAEHVHWYGLYIGNYPDLEQNQIERLCVKLNAL
jgi:CDP-6-deoxy-D-xylo-4-hexulose-3-dehydrase